jgi:hypothetical protein
MPLYEDPNIEGDYGVIVKLYKNGKYVDITESVRMSFNQSEFELIKTKTKTQMSFWTLVFGMTYYTLNIPLEL